jgi:hypothetical protein
MIHPTSITQFNRSNRELEAFWLFSMFVAGKNSDFAAAKVHAVMNKFGPEAEPITHMRLLTEQGIEDLLRSCRVGQYGRLTKAILGTMKVDLRTATLAELMAIHGVGPKTARFFLVHSRENCQHAVLDVHILHFLRDNGFPTAPKQTPSDKLYLFWEKVFLDFCDINYHGTPIPIIDLDIWTKYSGRNDDKYLKVEAGA